MSRDGFKLPRMKSSILKADGMQIVGIPSLWLPSHLKTSRLFIGNNSIGFFVIQSIIE